jgi:YgiT-type zinc finger domain-containing protein
MNCHICGTEMTPLNTDLPFKIGDKSIVIIKELPVIQCNNCGEYLIEDQVMERVESILAMIDISIELEIVRYAA